MVISNQTWFHSSATEQRVEDGLQVGQRDLAVEVLGERLQVDVGGINVVVDVVEMLRA